VSGAVPADVGGKVRHAAPRALVTAWSRRPSRGEAVAVTAASICVHSDTPGAARIGPAVRAAIEGAGHTVGSDLPAGAQSGMVSGRVGAAGD
jgi:5-oxoprolinase (ATP-hydrolysing) subunit A